MIRALTISSTCQGLINITPHVTEALQQMLRSGAMPLSPDRSGLCTLYIRHTSASLLIQENADPSAKHDLEKWLNRLVPENDPHFTHTNEGPDDMPSHIKAALTATSLSIPIIDGTLALGTWQGIYLWEHRRSSHTREIVAHIGP